MDEAKAIGFLGCGAMGGPMVRHLLAAGLQVIAYDPDGERLRAAVEAGAEAAGDESGVAAAADVVLACLTESGTTVRVFDEVLIAAARDGQLFVDLGTTVPAETRRLAQALAFRGAALVDAPVSGGTEGAERGDLFVFVGGEPEDVERARPMLEAVGGTAKLTHCGPVGAGQVVKGSNQLMMALGKAAYLEATAYAVRQGVDAETVCRAVGGEGTFRGDFTTIARMVASGRGEGIGVIYGELAYFLRQAAEAGFDLPLTDTLYAACEGGDPVIRERHRRVPSYWRELMEQG